MARVMGDAAEWASQQGHLVQRELVDMGRNAQPLMLEKRDNLQQTMLAKPAGVKAWAFQTRYGYVGDRARFKHLILDIINSSALRSAHGLREQKCKLLMSDK